MVHAFQVVHRVLRPGALLLDLRPAAEHRRVGTMRDGQFFETARLEEVLEEDRAADRAVRQALKQRLFRRVRRLKFKVNRYADTIQDFMDWYEEFSTEKPCQPSPKLLERIRSSSATQGQGAPIVITGPLVLNVLEKI